jgi:hypothetical protein
MMMMDSGIISKKGFFVFDCHQLSQAVLPQFCSRVSHILNPDEKAQLQRLHHAMRKQR